MCIATTVARPKWAEALFRSDPDIRVLIATDAAGEGIYIQNANLMVHYDLPWAPIGSNNDLVASTASASKKSVTSGILSPKRPVKATFISACSKNSEWSARRLKGKYSMFLEHYEFLLLTPQTPPIQCASTALAA